ANMYDATSTIIPAYVKVFVIPKSDLLTGGPIGTLHTFGSPPGPKLGNPVSGIQSFTIMPSVNYDGTPEHLIATPIESAGTLGRTTLFAIGDPGGTPSIVSMDLMLPNWNGPVHVDCGQLGGGYTIDSGFVGTMSLVERAGSLWAAHTAP